jgi:ribosomal protein L11 methyltransferase
VIVVDPGMAFGTAEHATTRGALRLLDPRVRPGDRVADVGTGSGILAIAAALLGAGDVLAVESDAWACAVALENVVRNEVADRVRVLGVEVGPELLPGEPPFDVLLANIESGTLRRLLPGLRGGVRTGGYAILGGVLLDEADGIVRAALEAGFSLDGEDREEGWWTGAFRASLPSRPSVPTPAPPPSEPELPPPGVASSEPTRAQSPARRPAPGREGST